MSMKGVMVKIPPLFRRTAPLFRRTTMTSKDFVDEFNEQCADDVHAIADNQGNIKILNRVDTILFDYNGDVWEFRGNGCSVLKFSAKTLELMTEYAKGDIDEHIGLIWGINHDN